MTTDMKYMRQEGLVDSKIFKCPINVIGAGGIGSFTTLALAKCGFSAIDVWDDDTIEEHNLPNQFYPYNCVGNVKVEALSAMVDMFTGTKVVVYNKRYDTSSPLLKGIVISAVDSMQAREEIYEHNKRNSNVIALIDGRMGANQLELYTTVMSKNTDRKKYAKTLWSDKDTADIPCTQRAVMYNVLTIASWIVNQVRLVLSKKAYNRCLILDLENMILIADK